MCTVSGWIEEATSPYWRETRPVASASERTSRTSPKFWLYGERHRLALLGARDVSRRRALVASRRGRLAAPLSLQIIGTSGVRRRREQEREGDGGKGGGHRCLCHDSSPSLDEGLGSPLLRRGRRTKPIMHIDLEGRSPGSGPTRLFPCLSATATIERCHLHDPLRVSGSRRVDDEAPALQRRPLRSRRGA